jgi:C4-dicarboxylate transporter DctM subunit
MPKWVKPLLIAPLPNWDADYSLKPDAQHPPPQSARPPAGRADVYPLDPADDAIGMPVRKDQPMINRIFKGVDKTMDWFLGLVMTVMLVVVTLQVWYRFVLNDPLAWSEELARYLFVWISFIGSAVGVRMNVHLGIDLIEKIMTPMGHKILSVIVNGLIQVFLLIVIFWGIKRELKFKDLPAVLAKSAVTTSTVMLLIATANIFGWILTAEQVPQQVAVHLVSLTSSKLVLYGLIVAMLLLVGTFMETTASLIILPPVFLPVIQQFGIDPVHFGVVMVTALAIGMLTPPLGICLFISCNIAGIPLSRIIPYIIPLLAIMIGCLLLITFVPDLVLFIPNLLEG